MTEPLACPLCQKCPRNTLELVGHLWTDHRNEFCSRQDESRFRWRCPCGWNADWYSPASRVEQLAAFRSHLAYEPPDHLAHHFLHEALRLSQMVDKARRL